MKLKFKKNIIIIIIIKRSYKSLNTGRGAYAGGGRQASLKLFCACECRSKKNAPAETIECNGWSYTDLDERCPQKFEVRHVVTASGAHRSRRLISSGGRRGKNCP